MNTTFPTHTALLPMPIHVDRRLLVSLLLALAALMVACSLLPSTPSAAVRGLPDPATTTGVGTTVPASWFEAILPASARMCPVTWPA